MKKILTLLAVCIMAASCEESTTNEYSGQSGVRFYRDPVTGVEYILYNGEAITPRLNPDGTPYTAWKKEM